MIRLAQSMMKHKEVIMEEQYILELKIKGNKVFHRIIPVNSSDRQYYRYLLDMKTIRTFLSILEHTSIDSLPDFWKDHDEEWFKIRRIEIL